MCCWAAVACKISNGGHNDSSGSSKNKLWIEKKNAINKCFLFPSHINKNSRFINITYFEKSYKISEDAVYI